MELSACFGLAWLTLRRNGLRSALTLLGITIGVGAVLTMVAVGNGARASIEDQVAAAGMNVITVTAGNYKMKGEDAGGGVVDHQASLVEPWEERADDGTRLLDEPTLRDERRWRRVFRPAVSRGASSPAVFYPRRAGGATFTLVGHPEDDPMEKHNHPTSRERLGDSAAGLGAAATLTRDDAKAIRDRIKG